MKLTARRIVIAVLGVLRRGTVRIGIKRLALCKRHIQLVRFVSRFQLGTARGQNRQCGRSHRKCHPPFHKKAPNSASLIRQIPTKHSSAEAGNPSPDGNIRTMTALAPAAALAQDSATRIRIAPANRDRFRRLELQLRHRIARQFPITRREACFGVLKLDLTLVADPDRVLDQIIAEEDRREKVTGVRLADPPHMPYWAELWDSAAGMAAKLARTPIEKKFRVLDLGCGMGLAGAAAAGRGADVLMADLETPALLFARLNTLPFAERVRIRKLDWRTDRLGERFDLILGSDILYERTQWEYLNKFWLAHLAHGGRIWLGEPGRQTGDLFIPWIKERGWNFADEKEQIESRAKPIRIFELTRPV
jgi:predicted nicotinamide N-methyase